MAVVRVFVEEPGPIDLSDCSYYKRYCGVLGYESATCSYGCREEPACVTDQPRFGWPAERPFDTNDVIVDIG